MDSQQEYLRNRVYEELLRINAGRHLVSYQLFPKAGIIELDCRGDHVFKVNDLGYMTYTLGLPINQKTERISKIKTAVLANYQRNQEGEWLWSYEDTHYDILNVLKEGVTTNETQRTDRALKSLAYKRDLEARRIPSISNGMGRTWHREITDH